MQKIFQQDSVDWANNQGTYHLTENFENSRWKVNGKVTLHKFQPKIEVVHSFWMVHTKLNVAYHLPISQFLLGSTLTPHLSLCWIQTVTDVAILQ